MAPRTKPKITLTLRTLDAAHQKRNLAEYEGFLEVEESAIAELSALVPVTAEMESFHRP